MAHESGTNKVVGSLAIKFLDVAIDAGATYDEIKSACELVPELMGHSMTPAWIYDEFGQRTNAIQCKP